MSNRNKLKLKKQVSMNLDTSIKDLDEDMIHEMAEYKSIPPVVLNVLYGVCVVLGHKPQPDEVSKLIKKPSNLLNKLKDYDPESLTLQKHMSLDKYVHHKEFDL
jgi:hypothetical protein